LILTTLEINRQGTQGKYDAAARGALDGEFGTHKDDEVVQKILESGSAQQVDVGFSLSSLSSL
jgi:ribosome maturation protein Sdo1